MRKCILRNLHLIKRYKIYNYKMYENFDIYLSDTLLFIYPFVKIKKIFKASTFHWITKILAAHRSAYML